MSISLTDADPNKSEEYSALLTSISKALRGGSVYGHIPGKLVELAEWLEAQREPTEDEIVKHVLALNSPRHEDNQGYNLDFHVLRQHNVQRCTEGFNQPLDEWSPMEWAAAICEEAGEIAGCTKKAYRKGYPMDYPNDEWIEDLSDELADCITYCDLLAARFGINLAHAVIRKFNVVSDRVDSDVLLPYNNELGHRHAMQKEIDYQKSRVHFYKQSRDRIAKVAVAMSVLAMSACVALTVVACF